MNRAPDKAGKYRTQAFCIIPRWTPAFPFKVYCHCGGAQRWIRPSGVRSFPQHTWKKTAGKFTYLSLSLLIFKMKVSWHPARPREAGSV